MARTPPPSTAPSPEASAQASTPLPERYEEALSELETLVSRLEAGALPLEELLVSYQRGAQLLELCRGRLDAIEDQVKVLEGGRLKPWNDA